jgi:hypothetical protein
VSISNFIDINKKNMQFNEIGLSELALGTLKTLFFDIPFTLIEKIPNHTCQHICYNMLTLAPALGFGIPFLLYKCYWKKETLESIFLNALLPTPQIIKGAHEDDPKYELTVKEGYKFHKLTDSNNSNTIVFLPGRYGSYENNKNLLNKLFKEAKYNIITWTPRQEEDNITYQYINEGVDKFIEYLYEDKNLTSGNTIFYAYSLGGVFLSMILQKDKDQNQSKFQGSYFVVERSFESLQETLNKVALKCLPVKWALDTCDKDLFGPDLFQEYSLSQATKGASGLHLPAKGDYTISEECSSFRCNVNENQETLFTTTSYGKPTWYEVGTASSTLVLNLIFLNGLLIATSIYISTMYLVLKNPHYFNTHAMPYAFTTDKVLQKLKQSQVKMNAVTKT